MTMIPIFFDTMLIEVICSWSKTFNLNSIQIWGHVTTTTTTTTVKTFDEILSTTKIYSHWTSRLRQAEDDFILIDDLINLIQFLFKEKSNFEVFKSWI